jgi:hypothetical protein
VITRIALNIRSARSRRALAYLQNTIVLSLLWLGSPAQVHADPSLAGQWSATESWQIIAIHTSLLPTGKVMYWENLANVTPRLWDPATDLIVSTTQLGYNAFCTGHSLLADGRLVVVGGHIATHIGLPNVSAYDPYTTSWTRYTDMNAGRWYPTSTTLANGDVLVVSGEIDATIGLNPLPQVWQASTGTWRDLSSAQLLIPIYPWMYQAPNGKVFYAGSSPLTRYLDTSGTGAWTDVGSTNFPRDRAQGSSVMYDDGKILIVGGDDPPTNSAEVINLNAESPIWRSVAAMTYPRRHHTATLLPDGKVLVTGGTSGSGFDDETSPVLTPELWDPATETWTPMASSPVPRLYHSTALLLPDGRVLTAGSGDYETAVNRPDVEFFSPPYLFQGPRPSITAAPTQVNYGQTFSVQTPDAAGITNVTWLRLGSVTHSFNQNQRINRLSFTTLSGSLNVTSPTSANLAPLGDYMLFILNSNGVPSIGRIVRLVNSSPYGGTAWAIPGRIQMEDFDTGGEGIAYRDTDAVNNGGLYRPGEGVDIQATADTGGGYNVGWMRAGEWMQYTVNVQAVGTYTLAARVAANGVGGTFHVEVNGVDKTGPLAIPNTGGWQQWQTITKTGVNLAAGVQIVRVVLDTNGPINFVGNVNYIDVSLVSLAASTLAVTSFPVAVTAGAAGSVTVTAKDVNGDVATGYIGTVRFTSSDAQASLPANYTFVVSDNGTHAFTNEVRLKTAGTQSITATDTVTGTIFGTESGITVSPGTFTKLQLLAPGETVAPGSATGKGGTPKYQTIGTPFSVTVNAVDGYWNLVAAVTDLVHISSSDDSATLPTNAALVAGTNTFSATLKTAGTATVTATDVTDGTKTASTTPSIPLTSGGISALVVSGFPASVMAGTAASVTVTAKDVNGDVATGYIGTVRFSSSDAQGGLPANYTFVAGDNGTHAFTSGVTLKTAGTQSITATDTVAVTILGSQTGIAVGPGPFTKLQLLAPGETAAPGSGTGKSGTPTAQTAGAPFTVTVNAVDAYWNVINTVSDTIQLTSTDGNATLPANAALASGTKTFSVTLKTGGTQSITASDVTNNAKTASTISITVNGSLPFGGTARAIPGRIQAEDFDTGGEGQAYHDLDAANNGGQYRLTEGVDIQATSDSGGGYNLGWVKAGEWLQYTVNVQTAGLYRLAARVASTGSGGTFHVEVNGIDKTGAFTIPNTGGWQQWQTLIKGGVNLNAGVQQLRVVLDSNASNNFVGNLNYIDLSLNSPPAVSLTSPGGNTTFIAPAALTLTASATDTDGSITKVEFFNGATLIGTATAAPYRMTWNNVGAGAYTLTAKATDSDGATTISSGVSITVDAPPAVSLTSPTSGATFPVGATIPLTATASDSDGTVSKVEFYAGATLIATVATAPYSATWSNVAAGGYTLTAKATDNVGATTTSGGVSITVGSPPTVNLTSPAAGATFTAPATIAAAATANASNGTIAKVEFYAGIASIGSATTAPYSITWSNVPVGTYTLTAMATDNSGASTISNGVTITVNAGSSAYGGSPRAIPGRIQVEDFDTGGEGVAYHDLDATNKGGQYRPTEGVDIETTTDPGGGYNVGWASAGEWLQYTVNVPTAGTYTLAVRGASNGTGGTFHIEVNGTDKTGPLTIPNTGGWQQWQTVTKTGVSLSVGVQVLRLVLDTNGANGFVGNLNYIDVTAVASSSPYGGTARAIPGRIQAEDFDVGGEGVAYHDLDATNNGGQYRPAEGVDIEATTDTGGGYSVGWTQAGGWLQYTVNVQTAGTYTLAVRVAANGVGGTFHVEVNGTDKTGPLTVPNTGGWQQWQTVTKTGVSLSAGVQKLRIMLDTKGASNFVGNFNYLDLTL